MQWFKHAKDYRNNASIQFLGRIYGVGVGYAYEVSGGLREGASDFSYRGWSFSSLLEHWD